MSREFRQAPSKDQPWPVMVYTGHPDGSSDSKVIDYNSAEDRRWLAGHSFWALANNRAVTTLAVNH